MKSSIDYAYYRISKLYYKYDGTTGVHAMLIISLTEGLLLLDVFLFLEGFILTPKQIQTSKLIGYVIVIISVFPLSLFNYIKYIKPKGIYNEFNIRWQNESIYKRVTKGFLIFISLLIPWALLFLLNGFKHHLL